MFQVGAAAVEAVLAARSQPKRDT
uniref:Uncharacterized protein n=1 Tax=Rhizophora mucronata TaxID=61149 RepID=A0A2P2NLZ7_RHIMU